MTTYPITPIVGFGWILAIRGAAQCASTFRYSRLLYVLAFLFIELCNIPWQDLLAKVL
jgi:hypothetical protein